MRVVFAYMLCWNLDALCGPVGISFFFMHHTNRRGPYDPAVVESAVWNRV